MTMHPIDIAILIGYLLLVVISGAMLAKRAAQNLDSYFLAGNKLPWYLLSVSNASGMFDITGTMWMVTLLFVYGMKSVWIPWLWPSFNVIFMMVYLAAWLRRSGVLTGGEWIRTRFGTGRGAELSQVSVVIFALTSVVGFLAYAFQGIGKFCQVFLPWDFTAAQYAMIFMTITTIYVILGGMYSVVVTDLVQFTILTIASVAIAVIAVMKTTREQIVAAVPEGWHGLFFGWNLDLDWSALIPEINNKIEADGYTMFGAFFMMMLFKGVLSSMAGPAPNYDMQRVLATRNPREAALMSGFVSVVLYFPRYLLLAGIGCLALVFFSPDLVAMGADADFEQILPYVINNFVPAGLVGLLLAGLLAAFMSTFDSTVNAGAAYLVNDVIKRYFAPEMSDKSAIRASYVCSILVVAVGIAFGSASDSIHDVLGWIVAGLFGGYIAPNLLKWHWWRLNGYGYFAGMLSGVGTALALPQLFPDWHDLFSAFPVILVISSIASVAVSLMTPPDDEETLKEFYRNVRPWGFWQPVDAKVRVESPDFQANTAFRRDMANILVGLVWHTTLAALPIALVMREPRTALISAVLLVVTSVVLKKNWYDRLEAA